MKKIIGIAAAVLAAFTLAGCSSNQDAPAPTTSTSASTTAPTTSIVTIPSTIAPTTPDQAAAQAAEAARVAAEQEAARVAAESSAAAQSAADQSAADQAEADRVAAEAQAAEAEAQASAADTPTLDAGLIACTANSEGSSSPTGRLLEAYESSHSQSDLNALRHWCEAEGAASEDTPETQPADASDVPTTSSQVVPCAQPGGPGSEHPCQ